MLVLRVYKSRDMKMIEYNGNDAEALKRRLAVIKPELIDRLCLWLLANKTTVIIDDCYDGGSGWQGANVMIGRANLSKNGYCLTNEDIELFLNGGQNPMWYHFWQEEFKMAQEWVRVNLKNKEKWQQ